MYSVYNLSQCVWIFLLICLRLALCNSLNVYTRMALHIRAGMSGLPRISVFTASITMQNIDEKSIDHGIKLVLLD